MGEIRSNNEGLRSSGCGADAQGTPSEAEAALASGKRDGLRVLLHSHRRRRGGAGGRGLTVARLDVSS